MLQKIIVLKSWSSYGYNFTVVRIKTVPYKTSVEGFNEITLGQRETDSKNRMMLISKLASTFLKYEK